MNVFERAARGQWRFSSGRGDLTAEQLFTLPLDSGNGFNLNSVAIAVDDELEGMARKNFIAPEKTDNRRAELEGKLELVKLVIASKIADKTAAETRATNMDKRRKILDALANKENEALTSATKEELLAQLEAIGA
jgi:hypothetical protein